MRPARYRVSASLAAAVASGFWLTACSVTPSNDVAESESATASVVPTKSVGAHIAAKQSQQSTPVSASTPASDEASDAPASWNAAHIGLDAAGQLSCQGHGDACQEWKAGKPVYCTTAIEYWTMSPEEEAEKITQVETSWGANCISLADLGWEKDHKYRGGINGCWFNETIGEDVYMWCVPGGGPTGSQGMICGFQKAFPGPDGTYAVTDCDHWMGGDWITPTEAT